MFDYVGNVMKLCIIAYKLIKNTAMENGIFAEMECCKN